MKNTGKRFKIVDNTISSTDSFLTNFETGDKFFLEEVDDKFLLFAWPKLGKQLNENIYSSPSASPLVLLPKNVISTQTCFTNVYSPTPSYTFNVDDGFVYQIQPNLTYDDYVYFIDKEINTSIVETYNKFDKVHLLFSGGSDSLVLLSYIIKNNLLDRTIIVTAENTAVNPENTIAIADPRKVILKKLLDWLRPRVSDIHEHNITKQDLINTINKGNVWQLKSYSTNYMFNYYNNSALLLGVKGNNTLMHRSVIAGQILRNSDQELNLSNTLFYTRELNHYNYTNDNIDIVDRFFAKKGYYKFNGMNGNKILFPLGTENIFKLLRSVIWSNVKVNVVSDALIPRYLINKNAGKYLNEYITYENATEWDNMDNQFINLNLIDSTILNIPNSLNHNERGLGYIYEELKKAKDSGVINLNLLLSIKSLQMIEDRYNAVL